MRVAERKRVFAFLIRCGAEVDTPSVYFSPLTLDRFGGSARHFSHSKPLMTVNDSLNKIAVSAVFATVMR